MEDERQRHDNQLQANQFDKTVTEDDDDFGVDEDDEELLKSLQMSMEENNDDEDEDDDDQDTNNNFVDELLQGLPGMDENDTKDIDNMANLLDAVDDNENTKSGIIIEHRTARQVSTTTITSRRGPWGDHMGRDSESEEDAAQNIVDTATFEPLKSSGATNVYSRTW